MENNKWFNVTIQINNLCNFKCEYCIGNLNKPSLYHRYIMSTDIIKFIVICINRYFNDSNIFIDLLGGEPLISKNINEVIDEVYKIQHLKSIRIMTNNSLPLNQIVIDNKIKYRISYHVKELNKYNYAYTQFYKNIEYLNNNNINYSIKLLAKDYDDTFAIDAYDKLKKFVDGHILDLRYVANTKYYQNDNVVKSPNIHIYNHVYPKRCITIIKDNNNVCKMRYLCDIFSTTFMDMYYLKNWTKLKKDADTIIECKNDSCICYACEG